MAYLHCHTKGCDWSQDDFYTKRYNPLTKIWESVKWLWVPRFIEFDSWLVDDLVEYTHIPVWVVSERAGQKKVFSWFWLLLELFKELKLMLIMKWWTFESWDKDRREGKAKCPKCGESNFAID